MSLNEEERKLVVTYRLEKAHNTMSDAEKVVGMEMWAAGANRLYYAAYYAVSALLIANGYTAKTHEGIIRMFNQHFVMNGKVDCDGTALQHFVHYAPYWRLRRLLRPTGERCRANGGTRTAIGRKRITTGSK